MIVIIFGFILAAFGVAGLLHSIMASTLKQIELNERLLRSYFISVVAYWVVVVLWAVLG